MGGGANNVLYCLTWRVRQRKGVSLSLLPSPSLSLQLSHPFSLSLPHSTSCYVVSHLLLCLRPYPSVPSWFFLELRGNWWGFLPGSRPCPSHRPWFSQQPLELHKRQMTGEQCYVITNMSCFADKPEPKKQPSGYKLWINKIKYLPASEYFALYCLSYYFLTPYEFCSLRNVPSNCLIRTGLKSVRYLPWDWALALLGHCLGKQAGGGACPIGKGSSDSMLWLLMRGFILLVCYLFFT